MVNRSVTMAFATTRLPFLMDQYSGEMECVPKAIFDNTIARLPLGHTEMAFLDRLLLVCIDRFHDDRGTLQIVRPRIVEMRVKDQRSLS